MTKKNKKFLIIGLLLLGSVIAVALGLKYFPFTKVVKMPAGSEQEFMSAEKKINLPPHTLYYDYEVAPGKELPNGFYKGQAHSGQYSVKAFGQNSFSAVVERTVKEVGAENLKALAISAWIYVFPTKTDVKGRLVFTASNEVGVNVCWKGLALEEPEVPRGKWFKISAYFDLKDVQFKPGYKLQFYFWNNSSTDILIDDYFISFGGPVDRRGDSAWVDMTKPAGFVARYNFPPFEVSLLEKESPGKTVKPGDIDPDDFPVSGNFFSGGSDGLLVINKDGRTSAYAFCSDNGEFSKAGLTNPSLPAQVAPVKKVIKGKFFSSSSDQFIVSGEKGWMICVLKPPEKLCNSSGNEQTGMRVIWKSATPVAAIYAGDLNGDQLSEVLIISGNGSWKVMAFIPGGNAGGSWNELAADGGTPNKEWDLSIHDAGVSVGRFIPGISHDVLLTVKRNRSDGKSSYALCKLNLSGKRWDPWFGEKQDRQGKTIGPDTLKPTDVFYTIPGEGNKVTVYRYNRDWRYDLKEVRFNDSTFSIVSAVDFHGYDKDQNPKYYESLVLIPGCFQNPAAGSFLVVGHVAKSRRYQSILPDFVQLYSLPKKK